MESIGLQLLSRFVAAGCCMQGEVNPRDAVHLLITSRRWESEPLQDQYHTPLRISSSTRGMAQMILGLFDVPRDSTARARAAADGHCTLVEARIVKDHFTRYLDLRNNNGDDDDDDDVGVEEVVQRAHGALGNFIEANQGCSSSS
jgi:hypothetical protein